MSINTENRRSPLPVAASNWALFLDVDGTLLDIAPAPDAVEIPPGLPRCLDDAARALGGALALISGRPIAWIDKKLTPDRLPAAGQHGAEVRLSSGGPVNALVKRPDLSLLRTRATELAAAMPGVIVEEKSFGIALHYRSAPQWAGELRRRMEVLMQDMDGGLHLLAGKMVFEIKPAVAWKERAVEMFMNVPPFVGRIPVFVGDDLTDENGFRAARRRGGYAIQVGPTRSEQSTSWVENPAAVRDWLAALPTIVQSKAAS